MTDVSPLDIFRQLRTKLIKSYLYTNSRLNKGGVVKVRTMTWEKLDKGMAQQGV